MDRNVSTQHARSVRPRKMRRWMIFVVLIFMVSVSCVCGTENLPDFITDIIGGDETQSGTLPENQPMTGVLLQDDFSDPNSGWEIGEFDGGSIGYKDGVYFVISSQKSTAMWGAAQQVFKDVVIEVDATPVRSPSNQNNDFGVMCRLQFNGDGYSMNISADGYYSIQIAQNDQFTDLVEWMESSAIRTGNVTNRIRTVCDGNKLVLFVNGTLLAEVTDNTFSEGDVALSATTYENDLTEVHFDNVVVRTP